MKGLKENSPPEDSGEAGETVELEATDSAPRLDKWLADQLLDISRSMAKKLIEEGNVKLAGSDATPKPKDKVEEGARYLVEIPPLEEARPEPEDISLEIVYEDADLLVVNKAPGMVVHPSAGHPRGTLVNALLAHCGDSLSGINGVRRPGILHRLDLDTSGALLVAKNDAAHQALADQLRARTLRREYLALVQGEPKEEAGTIETFLGRDARNRLRRTVVPEGRNDARRGVTHWRVVQRFHGAALLLCRLETGRTHQIRVHMRHIGHPVVGDDLYGYDPSIVFGRQASHYVNPVRMALLQVKRQMLHAFRMQFVHPKAAEVEAMTCHAPLPADLLAVSQELAKAAGIEFNLDAAVAALRPESEMKASDA